MSLAGKIIGWRSVIEHLVLNLFALLAFHFLSPQLIPRHHAYRTCLKWRRVERLSLWLASLHSFACRARYRLY